VIEAGPDLKDLLSRAEAAIAAPARNGHDGAKATDRRRG
jgi:hypothetical protein